MIRTLLALALLLIAVLAGVAIGETSIEPGVVVQVLAMMAGGKMVAEEVTDSGFFFLVIDPALLGDAAEFKANVTALVGHIEGSRPAPGTDRVRVHGRGSLAK